MALTKYDIRRLLNMQPGDQGVLVPGAGAGHGAADVVHICPECGGATAELLGAATTVALCWACHGVGHLDDHGLHVYQQQLNQRAAR